MNGKHGGCGGPAGFAGGGGTGGGCWFGGGSGVGAIGANGHGEDSSPDAGGNRTRVRKTPRRTSKAYNILHVSVISHTRKSLVVSEHQQLKTNIGYPTIQCPHFWGLQNNYQASIMSNKTAPTRSRIRSMPRQKKNKYKKNKNLTEYWKMNLDYECEQCREIAKINLSRIQEEYTDPISIIGLVFSCAAVAITLLGSIFQATQILDQNSIIMEKGAPKYHSYADELANTAMILVIILLLFLVTAVVIFTYKIQKYNSRHIEATRGSEVIIEELYRCAPKKKKCRLHNGIPTRSWDAIFLRLMLDIPSAKK